MRTPVFEPQGFAGTRNPTVVLSIAAREAGQATVAFHSLKSKASAGRTLSIASWLSTTDRSMAGSKADNTWTEVWFFFFPFFFWFGAMAAERIGAGSGQGRCRLFQGDGKFWKRAASDGGGVV